MFYFRYMSHFSFTVIVSINIELLYLFSITQSELSAYITIWFFIWSQYIHSILSFMLTIDIGHKAGLQTSASQTNKPNVTNEKHHEEILRGAGLKQEPIVFWESPNCDNHYSKDEQYWVSSVDKCKTLYDYSLWVSRVFTITAAAFGY